VIKQCRQVVNSAGILAQSEISKAKAKLSEDREDGEISTGEYRDGLEKLMHKEIASISQKQRNDSNYRRSSGPGGGCLGTYGNVLSCVQNRSALGAQKSAMLTKGPMETSALPSVSCAANS
jgi:hypothetical protein